LKAFEDLREKLKAQSKENAALKDDLKVSSIKVRQSEEALSSTLTTNMELKERACSLQSQNEELKKKMTLLKETVQGQANYRDEVEFAKETLLQVKTQCDTLEK
jgi:predicted nuclease with TOPRIM domain